MKTRPLAEALARVETWTPDVQNELAGIDRGFRVANEGRFGNDAQVKAALGKFRRA